MGLRLDQLTREIFARMAPAEQAAYAREAAIRPPARRVPRFVSEEPGSRNPDRLEREEQRTFANHCLRQGLAFVWHSTAHKTKASIGCPDFIIAVGGHTLWLEFKRPGGKLSSEQIDFRDRLLRQGALYYIVQDAAEAITITQSRRS